MTFWKLIRRSLRFHARSHLGVVLGAAIGSAVLIGALVVGDSVKESLREKGLQRIGQAEFAMASQDRFFREQLASDVYSSLTNAGDFYAGGEYASALILPATLSLPDGSARANRVNVIGVNDSFTILMRWHSLTNLEKNSVCLNEDIAAKLRAKKGDTVILKIRKASKWESESPMANQPNSMITLRLVVQDIVSANDGGNLSLTSLSSSPLNVFVPISTLQEAMDIPEKANLLLMGETLMKGTRRISAFEKWLRERRRALFGVPTGIQTGIAHSSTSSFTISFQASRPTSLSEHPDFSPRSFALRQSWNFKDLQIEAVIQTNSSGVELRSERIFIEPAIIRSVHAEPTFMLLLRGSKPGVDFTQVASAEVLSKTWPSLISSNAQPLLTYLVNLLGNRTNKTPYSMVTAAGTPWTPADMRDDEIILNQWLADDLQAKQGDEISLTYFDPESGTRLVERTNTFHIRGIVPMEMPWADRTLMPDFPGIEKAESTSDWDAGFPLVHKIRPKDEDYWKKYRGTPKAFVTLAAGKKMWANRFGELTAIRFPIPAMGGTRSTASQTSPENTVRDGVELVPPNVAEFRAALEKKILASLKPEEIGLRFEPVREQVLKAAEQSQDFGQLFLGFSFFLIVAALVLMALLFQFGLEQRTTEIGTLLALGFTQKQVRRLLLREGIVLALIGGAIGALGGIFYAKAMLHGLTTVWRDAVGTSSLQFHASPETLAIGFLASTVVATLTIWLTLRKQAKRPARELLADEFQVSGFKFQVRRSGIGNLIGIIATLFAAGLIVWAISKGETANAEIFFSAGALVLIGGLAFVSALFRPHPHERENRLQSVGKSHVSLSLLGLRGATRRRKRSLATIAMIACGCFLIVAISAFRLDSNLNATKRSSGTGGFALIGETTMPVVQDLNSTAGKNFFGLGEKDLAGVNFVPFRVHDGDEASCLNLNRAQKPRVLGVKPDDLANRKTFSFAGTSGDVYTNPWLLLRTAKISSDVIPAIGDVNSIQWALHKKIGDTIDYTDERGNVFRLRLVGAVANSILQGSLIIDESEFVKRFPNESGYKMFLIDAPTNQVAEVSAKLSRAMEDVGLELTPAARRLNEFNAVQNTYLGTFQILGGLGLLLGSAGLGIVVLRNVLERRGELGLLVAVGFRKRALQWMLLSEHGALLGLGLGVGLLAAVVAILPSLISPSAEIPFLSIGITLGAVLLNGALWTWIATKVALRGNLLAALRNE